MPTHDSNNESVHILTFFKLFETAHKRINEAVLKLFVSNMGKMAVECGTNGHETKKLVSVLEVRIFFHNFFYFHLH